jgi:hypothetical protein
MSRSAPLTYVCQEVKEIQNTARVSKATFIATCALVKSIEFSLDCVERVLKIIRSRNTCLRLRIQISTGSLRSSCMVLKNDTESVDSLADKIGVWFLISFILSVSHCTMLTDRTS